MASQFLLNQFRFSWEEFYISAVLETDNARLQQVIKSAEVVIVERLRALTNCREHKLELQAVEDALYTLAALKGESKTV
jgi:ABC-type transporter Mla MlaB component